MNVSVQAAGVRKRDEAQDRKQRQRSKDGEDGDDPQVLTEGRQKRTQNTKKKCKKDAERPRERHVGNRGSVAKMVMMRSLLQKRVHESDEQSDIHVPVFPRTRRAARADAISARKR
jgi:hypothetical protein